MNATPTVRAAAVVVGLLAVLSPAFAREASACSCGRSSPCQALWFGWQSANVFEATVVSVEPGPLERVESGGRVTWRVAKSIVRLTDVRSILGESDTTVTTSAISSCGVTFVPGKRYVIDAGRRVEGEFSVSACSYTSQAPGSRELLDYLERLDDPTPSGRISGTVIYSLSSFMLNRADKKIPTGLDGLMVWLDGDVKRTARPDVGGAFSFDELPAGQYRLWVSTDQPVASAPELKEVLLASPHACVNTMLWLNLDSSLSGSVVDPRGRPVTKARIALRHAEVPDARWGPEYFWETPDSEGRFTFKGLAPGHYVVGLNIDSGPDNDSDFLPVYGTDPVSGAPVIDFPLGARVQLAPFVAVTPPRTMHTGRVVWPDGSPGAGARVEITEIGEHRVPLGLKRVVSADSAGRFQFLAVEGQPLHFFARGERTGPLPEQAAGSVMVKVDAVRREVVLELRR